MDQNPDIDKFAKAKIEEPDPNLPIRLSLLKQDGEPREANVVYTKIFEFEEKSTQLSRAVASGGEIVRKFHRIRNKELIKFLGQELEGLRPIHAISIASVGVVCNPGNDHFNHSFLDLLGTVDEVNRAEQLIIEHVLKTYSSLLFPVILMPAKIFWAKMKIPLHKVCRLLGIYGNNLLRMEMESGVWIKIEEEPSPGDGEWERLVKVYGPSENVKKAMPLIQALIFDQREEITAAEALQELLNETKEPSCLELIGGKNCKEGDLERKKKKQKLEEPSWSQTFGRIIPCPEKTEEDSGEPEKGKEAGEGSSS